MNLNMHLSYRTRALYSVATAPSHKQSDDRSRR